MADWELHPLFRLSTGSNMLTIHEALEYNISFPHKWIREVLPIYLGRCYYAPTHACKDLPDPDPHRLRNFNSIFGGRTGIRRFIQSVWAPNHTPQHCDRRRWRSRWRDGVPHRTPTSDGGPAGAHLEAGRGIISVWVPLPCTDWVVISVTCPDLVAWYAL